MRGPEGVFVDGMGEADGGGAGGGVVVERDGAGEGAQGVRVG